MEVSIRSQRAAASPRGRPSVSREEVNFKIMMVVNCKNGGCCSGGAHGSVLAMI